VPVAAINRAWEDHGGMLRELRLVEGQLGPERAPPSGEESAESAESAGSADELLRTMVGAIAEPPFVEAWRIFTAVREQALAHGAGRLGAVVDVELVLSERAGASASRLDAVFDSAGALYGRGSRLLTPEPGPLSVALRRWLVGELVLQSTGRAATAWGAAEPG
jgi:hypothetical protein